MKIKSLDECSLRSLLISLDFKIAKNSNFTLKKNNLNIQGVVELASIIFIDNQGVSCLIDLRLSQYRRIKEINYFDFGWEEEFLLDEKKSFNKYIVYFVDDDIEPSKELVPKEYHLHKSVVSFMRFIYPKTKLNNILTTNEYNSILLENVNLKKKDKKHPAISVITVVFNNVQFIEQCIQSVINQINKSYEYIIIDGGSTDGTLKIIKKYINYIDLLISEKDKGIFDAMNKGILNSKGNFKIFLNSDDVFYSPKSLSLDLIDKKKASVGQAIMVGEHLNWLRPYSKKSNIYRYSHQAFFMPNKSFFDLNYKVGADTFLMKKFENNFHFVPEIISVFRMGGHSNQDYKMMNIIDRYRLFGIIGIIKMIIKLCIIYFFGIKFYEQCIRFKEKYV